MPAASVLKTILLKNAADGAVASDLKPATPVHTAPEGAVKPWLKGNAGATIKANPVKSLATILATGAGSYFGGKALLGDSLAKEVDRNGNNPVVQGAAGLIDAGGAVADRVADPFKGVGGTDPNSLPAPPAKPGMLENYWNKLKSGDTATVAGTGAAALLAAVLTHNLLKKRSKR